LTTCYAPEKDKIEVFLHRSQQLHSAKNKGCFHSCMKRIGHMPSLAKEVADLASIAFNAYTLALPFWLPSSSTLIRRPHWFGFIAFGDPILALPISLQSYSALILRSRLFDSNRLRRLYFGLAVFAPIHFGAYTLASPMWLQSSPALIEERQGADLRWKSGPRKIGHKRFSFQIEVFEESKHAHSK
jgi:hypothetical protein